MSVAPRAERVPTSGGESPLLRPWRRDDADWYVAQLGDPAIRRFTTESPETTASQFRTALARLGSTAGQVGFAIVDPDTGQPAGNIAAALETDGAHIGYWLVPTARGRGLARRAVSELCGWVRSSWPEVTAARLRIDDGNEASIRVAEALGFVLEPDRDETRTVGEESQPVRWWSLAW